MHVLLQELSATNLSGCSPNDLPKKRKYLSRSPRIPFNSAQLSVLEERFRQAPYLSGAEVQRLANELEMSDVREAVFVVASIMIPRYNEPAKYPTPYYGKRLATLPTHTPVETAP
ncbi:lipoyltransferase 1: mitochondrial-like [Tropilaelaps mercedesae]|uniref:Lipoyltransferase 1: mitochondrial-like n=1 Tax=Tropilaelaps mercedesae TaxID=418985 RepID=A0A1V9X0N7_9ACAR|nr:lipoyltransferase 1: mitochondrial-like [Tropilaelaps mercedesae]